MDSRTSRMKNLDRTYPAAEIFQVGIAKKKDNESKCMDYCAQIYGFSLITGDTLVTVSHATPCHFCDNPICRSFMIIPVNKKSLTSKFLFHCKDDEAVIKKPRHVSH